MDDNNRTSASVRMFLESIVIEEALLWLLHDCCLLFLTNNKSGNLIINGTITENYNCSGTFISTLIVCVCYMCVFRLDVY